MSDLGTLRPSLWTGTADYFATGEGRTIVGYITRADSGEQMVKFFADKFGDWLAKGCKVEKGVARNRVTQFLWANELLSWIESCDLRGGYVDLRCSVLVNFR